MCLQQISLLHEMMSAFFNALSIALLKNLLLKYSEIVSGGNDADVRYYNIVTKTCTVYRHHLKKILRLTINPQMKHTFLTCSADGTIRMFDVRQKYNNSETLPLNFVGGEDDFIQPQALGGGPLNRQRVDESVNNSLVVDYTRLNGSR